MKDTKTTIIFNRCIKGEYWRIGFKTGWQTYDPGQFVMLSVPGEETFLRRPFSICRLRDGIVEICYKVVGKGTLAMSGLKVGSGLFVLGPLGRGFDISNFGFRIADLNQFAIRNSRSAILVAGGYGIAPLLGLAERLSSGGLQAATILFYGAKTADDLLYLDEFEKLGVELRLATEDGSKGSKGLVTDVLKAYFEAPRPSPSPQGGEGRGEGESRATNDERRTTIYACGPKGMLDSFSSFVFRPSSFVRCQLSLESHMACGIGTCMGCVVKNSEGEYVRVCKEGPVFNAEQLADSG